MAQVNGKKIQSINAIQNSVQQLVREIGELSKQIEGVREPNPDLATPTKEMVDEIGKLRGRPLQFPYVGSGLGRGPYVELEDGSVKLDLINSIGVHILGHSHPRVIEASLKGALQDVVMQGNLQPNREYRDFSKKLIDVASRKSRLKHVWLATCGTMANENALKACRQKRDAARMIIAMQSAFAGRSTMMAEVTDNPAFKQGLPDYNEVLRVPWFDPADKHSSEKSLNVLKEHVAKHGKNIGCFSFEPVQGEGGFRTAPREFFLPILEFCKSQGIPVWLDEVQTFMRTGEFFAFQKLEFGEFVDVCTIAKTAQAGATFFTEELNPKPGLIAGTFSGATAAISAGLEILNILDDGKHMGPQGRIAEIHKEFVEMLHRLNTTTCKGLLRDAGGMGLMVAVTPLDGSKEKVNQLLQTLYKNGLVAFSCGHGPFRLRFLLPAILKSEDVAVAERIIVKSITELA